MNMEFIGKLPIPKDIKEQYPVSEEGLMIKAKRDKEIKDIFSGADKNRIVRALLSADLTITSRQYIGYETDTGYHHYVVDVENHYKMEDL